MRVHLFKGLSADDLSEVERRMQPRNFEAGALIVRQGDVGEEFFVIGSGTVEVFVSDPHSDTERVLRRLGPGAQFGEIALLSEHSLRTASVRAVTDVDTNVLTREAFQQLLGRRAFASGLLHNLAARLQTVTDGAVFRTIEDSDIEAGDDLVHAILTVEEARRHQALPVGLVATGPTPTLLLAMVDPFPISKRNALRGLSHLKRFDLEFAYLRTDDFPALLQAVYGDDECARSFDVSSVTCLVGQEELALFSREDDMLAEVISDAIERGASDLHFEPLGETGQIRWRLDGSLVPLRTGIERTEFELITSRLSVLSQIDTTRRMTPQDGRFQVRHPIGQVEVRVASMPSADGLHVVARILDPRQAVFDLPALVQPRTACALIEDLALTGSGLLLTCGPTGSGKTTTLQACLDSIWRQSETIKVTTIEDPVEYRVPFAVQTQVNRAHGLDFPEAIRAVLRQDPDVILVGEIRDPESAQIALRASVTGHMVLSSLHTQVALEAIPALRNLGIDDYLLATALTGIISQRLVPRLPDDAEPIGRDADADWLVEAGVLTDEERDLCRDSRATAGRVAVFEVLALTEDLREGIEKGLAWTDLWQMLLAMDGEGSPDYLSARRSARHLLLEGLVSPRSIRQSLPRRLLLSDR